MLCLKIVVTSHLISRGAREPQEEAHRGQDEEFARSPAVARLMGERREVYRLRKDGTEFPTESSITRLGIVKGMLFTEIVIEVTDRKSYEAAQRELEQLAQVKARLAGPPNFIARLMIPIIICSLGCHSEQFLLRQALGHSQDLTENSRCVIIARPNSTLVTYPHIGFKLRPFPATSIGLKLRESGFFKQSYRVVHSIRVLSFRHTECLTLRAERILLSPNAGGHDERYATTFPPEGCPEPSTNTRFPGERNLAGNRLPLTCQQSGVATQGSSAAGTR